MHRAISRAFRGTCRKWRENDCPIAAGEEVRKKKDDDGKKDFVPPKHNWEEAVTWTSGLVLGYQLTHGRRRSLIEECTPVTTIYPGARPSLQQESPLPATPELPEKSCPFTLTPRVFNQPIFTTALSVNQSSSAASASSVVSSIDITPFIHDDLQESELPDKLSSPSIVEDDDIVFAYESDVDDEIKRKVSATRKPSVLKRIGNNPAEYGTKFGADLLSVLGAFEFLNAETQAKRSFSGTKVLEEAQGLKDKKSNSRRRKNGTSMSGDLDLTSALDPPIRAIELMRKGAELGSCRALYNMGVAYERLNDINLAREYYKKAADLGHPLATYNCAVFALKDGRLTEGYALMKLASDFGVPEANEFMKPTACRKESMAVQIEVGKV